MGLSNSINPELAAVQSLIQKHGGVDGLVRQFEKQGLGPVIRSWVGQGHKQPISSDQLYRALGYETLQKVGAELGLAPGEVASTLSVILPKAVEKMTSSRTPSRGAAATPAGRFPWTGKKKTL